MAERRLINVPDGCRDRAPGPGRRRHQLDLHDLQRAVPEGRIENYHGPAGSPLLYGDTIIIYPDQGASFGAGGINRSAAGAFVIAVDAESGETRWRTDRSASVGWGTPIAISLGDHDELIVSSSRDVRSYDPTTGDELWSCDGNLFEAIPTPVVGHGLVFCTSGRAGPTLAIRPGGRGNVTESHVEWKTTRGSLFVPSAVLYGDYLYTLNDMSSIITCLNATMGETVWQERLGRPRREGISASPVVVDDKLFVTNDAGVVSTIYSGCAGGESFVDGRDVDVYGVGELFRVATGEDGNDRQPGFTHRAEHQAVAFSQPIFRELEISQLVPFERIGAGEVEHQVRLVRCDLRQGGLELLQVGRVTRAGWQTDVE